MKAKKYVFKPYLKIFSDLFSKEKKRVLNIFQGKYCDIQHIGSTAVPGLGGKGIIDIALAVKKKDIKEASHKLTSLGYTFRESGSTDERLFFRVDLPDELEGVRRYHMHLTFLESIEWKTLLAFRDYLLANPKLAQEYGELKRKTAEKVNEDGALYRKKKAPFFQKILLKALK